MQVRRSSGMLWYLSLAAVLCIGGWILIGGQQSKAERKIEGNPAVATVRRGDLRITVQGKGKLVPQDTVLLEQQVEGMLTVTHLVPEGTLVKKDEVLIVFDDAPIRAVLREYEEQLRAAKADAEIAEEELKIVEHENAASLNQAQLRVRKAENDLQKTREGEHPRRLLELEFAVERVESELLQADDGLKSTQNPTIVELGAVSRSEIEQARLLRRSAEINLKLARENLIEFKEFTQPAQLDEKQAEVATAKAELKKTVDTNENRIRQKKADLAQKKDKLKQASIMIEEVRKRMEWVTLRAPRDGIVIYGSGRDDDFHYGGESDKLKVGGTFSKGRVLMNLPSLERMQVEAQVDENDVTKITNGMRARIFADAYPDLSLTGRVTQIGNIALRSWSATTPKFAVTIALPEQTQDIRPGISARCEIEVAIHRDVLLAPVSCVFFKGSTHVVFDALLGEAVEVEIGAFNDTQVELRSGGYDGQQLLLYPPPNTKVSGPDAVYGSRRGATESNLDEVDEDMEAEMETMPAEGSPAEMPPGFSGLLQGLDPQKLEELKRQYERGELQIQGVSPDQLKLIYEQLQQGQR